MIHPVARFAVYVSFGLGGKVPWHTMAWWYTRNSNPHISWEVAHELAPLKRPIGEEDDVWNSIRQVMVDINEESTGETP